MEIETIGDRVRLLRKKNKLNQTEFGKKLSVKTSTVAGWENNLRFINDRTIKDICREYGTNEYWLRTGEGKMYTKKEEPLELLIERFISIMSSDDIYHKKLLKSILDLSSENATILIKSLDIMNEIIGTKKTD